MSGAGRSTAPGGSDRWTGTPSALMGPAPGCTRSTTIPRASVSGAADRATESVEQLVVGRADGEPAIRGAQRLVGRAQPMGGAERLRRAAGGPVLGGLPDGERHRRLEQRRVDELPFARRLAMLERAEHAVGAEEPGGTVADGNPGLRTRARLPAGDADDRTHALRDEVVAAA